MRTALRASSSSVRFVSRLVEMSLEVDEEQVTRLGAAERERLDPASG